MLKMHMNTETTLDFIEGDITSTFVATAPKHSMNGSISVSP
jgi:hypothetical protein